MSARTYVVAHKRGRMTVIVQQSVIDLRGERDAVAEAAWRKLMGQNSLGEDINKNLVTRKIILEETLSRYENYRPDVYRTFRDAIKITWMGIVR